MTTPTTTGDTFLYVPKPPIPGPESGPQPDADADADVFAVPAPAPDPLAWMSGEWTGSGFNTIWRPFFGGAEDEFLELDLTTDTITFINPLDSIPNRGFDQPDITMHGITYTNHIEDAVTGGGLHVEPGVWISVPATTKPEEPPTVARLASIPHGTVVLAQGLATFAGDVWPAMPDSNIVPFEIGEEPVLNSDPHFARKLAKAKKKFPQMVLAAGNEFRMPPGANPPGFTQAMVDNPTTALLAPPTGATFHDTITLTVTTLPVPTLGGGTANTAFLEINADAVQVVATFQQSLVTPAGGEPFRWLQYVQTVLLNFDEISWPHVTVGSLRSAVPA